MLPRVLQLFCELGSGRGSTVKEVQWVVQRLFDKGRLSAYLLVTRMDKMAIETDHDQNVRIVSIDVPLDELVSFAFKWVFASILAVGVLIALPVAFVALVIYANS